MVSLEFEGFISTTVARVPALVRRGTESEVSVDSSWNIGSIGFGGPALRGPSTSRLLTEPPLSPPVSGPSPTASAQPAQPTPLRMAPQPAEQPLVAPPAPVEPTPAGPVEPALRTTASLESLLMRFRLITSDQLDEALRAKVETGKDVGAIVVERGWVNEDQLARLLSYAPATAPEPANPAPAQLAADPAAEAGALQPEAGHESVDEAAPLPPLAAPALERVEDSAPAQDESPPALELVEEPASEPVMEAEPVVEAEPVADAQTEPEALIEPLTELAPLVERKPFPELEPLAEPEPLPTLERVTEAEPVAAVEPLSEAEPVAEPEPVAEAEPVTEAVHAADPEPAAEAEPVEEAAPEPVAVEQPAMAAEAQPATQVVRFVEPEPVETIARVFVRLSNGERIEIGSFEEVALATARASEIVAELSASGATWPFFAGRFIRPDAIVSVDVDATVVRYA
jgi:hypothetical protein